MAQTATFIKAMILKTKDTFTTIQRHNNKKYFGYIKIAIDCLSYLLRYIFSRLTILLTSRTCQQSNISTSELKIKRTNININMNYLNFKSFKKICRFNQLKQKDEC